MKKGHKKRIMNVWFPWLVSERLVRREPELAKQVLGAIEERRGRLVLAAVNRRALHGGLKPGMVLADALGLTPVHINRVLRKLREEGIMEIGRGSLMITDPSKLARIAGFQDNYLHRRLRSPA